MLKNIQSGGLTLISYLRYLKTSNPREGEGFLHGHCFFNLFSLYVQCTHSLFSMTGNEQFPHLYAADTIAGLHFVSSFQTQSDVKNELANSSDYWWAISFSLIGTGQNTPLILFNIVYPMFRN
jgi:hypothetical protein